MAVLALGLTGQHRYAHFLVDFLRDPAAAVREEALAALLTLATPDSVRLVPHVLPVVESGTEEQRGLGIRILRRIGDSSCILPLLAAAESFSPVERRQAEELVVDPRADHPLVTVHCAALAPTLLESELFGHEKGGVYGRA